MNGNDIAADKLHPAEIDIQFPRQLGNNDDRFGIIKKHAPGTGGQIGRFMSVRAAKSLLRI